MMRGWGLVGFALCGLMCSQHEFADAGGKWWKHSCAAPYGCGAPMGCGAPACSMPGCFGPTCGGCAVPACHGPFAPLVAHYYTGCGAPVCSGPAFGCGAPVCSLPGCGMPMCSGPTCGCGVPMGCGVPGCALPMGAYGVPAYAPQMGFDDGDGLPLMTQMPNYHQPVPPMSAPIPSVPPVEDIVW